jgi:glycerol uptake facilitator-like aquaporin
MSKYVQDTDENGVDLPSRSESKDVENGSETRIERSATREYLLAAVQRSGLQQQLVEKKIEKVVEAAVRDRTPEAKAGRRRMLIRAAYGEFMCTFLFYGPIFCCIANCYVNKWDADLSSLATAFVAGFQAVGISFAFSSISGAQFNSAISFALWLTGKLSNRRAALYIFVQLFASIMAMVLVTCIFDGDMHNIYTAIAVIPPNTSNLGRIFATEFFTTFFLTYIAFTVAFEDAENQKKDTMSFKAISDTKGLTLYTSTPQSRTGFAPFSIGLMIFSNALIGGASGAAFNPGRVFGPAMFSRHWDYTYLYWFGEFLGAACAGLLVNNMHRFGLESREKNEITATQAVGSALKDGGGSLPIVTPATAEINLDETTKNPLAIKHVVL